MRALYLSVLLGSFRFITVLSLVVIGSIALVRYAPGYLSDTRELDVRYAAAAKVELTREASQSMSVKGMALQGVRRALKGDFGTSRQYEIPVTVLLHDRLAVSARLLVESIVLAWILSLCFSLWSALKPGLGRLWRLLSAVLLALPASVLSTVFLLNDTGGPVLVLTLILVVRDFLQLERIIKSALNELPILQAHTQGIRWHRILVRYAYPAVAPQLVAVAGLSIITGLSTLIPVEVLFGIPGVGQLAWDAAMNRDLPVLLAVTALMATVIALLNSLFGRSHMSTMEAA